MTYLDDAAAELARVRAANGLRADRARAARKDGQYALAAELDAEVIATSLRLAEDYITLAKVARDTGPPPAVTPEPGQE